MIRLIDEFSVVLGDNASKLASRVSTLLPGNAAAPPAPDKAPVLEAPVCCIKLSFFLLLPSFFFFAFVCVGDAAGRVLSSSSIRLAATHDRAVECVGSVEFGADARGRVRGPVLSSRRLDSSFSKEFESMLCVRVLFQRAEHERKRRARAQTRASEREAARKLASRRKVKSGISSV